MIDGKALWSKHDEKRKTSIGPGSKEYKIDFHFHTPASKSDYKEKEASYDDIAKALAENNIDAVFVTDHNCWEGIKQLKEACKRNGDRTKVLPGVELTLETEAIQLIEEEKGKKKIGIAKFHCLALFPDDDNYESKIRSLITNDQTDNEILKKEPVDRVLRLKLEQVHEKIKKWGGIFVPAHLNQGKSVTSSRSLDDVYSDKLTLDYLEKYFDAVEIRKKENAKIFNGEFEISVGEKVPKMTCIMGSDAHDLKTIGRKSTFLVLDSLNFENISDSLKHPDRVKLEPQFKNIDMIESLVVNGSFIRDISIFFNHRINALIGAKGSGKTSIIEVIRFALGYEVKEEKRNDKKNYLQHILGPSGEVSVVVKTVDHGKFLFYRKFSDPESLVFSEDFTKIDRGVVIPSMFNLSITSSGEITELAVDRKSQLELIDNYENSGAIIKANKKIQLIMSDLPQNYIQYVRLEKKFRELKKQVDALLLKEKSFEKIKASSIQSLQEEKEKRVTELQSLINIEESILNFKEPEVASLDKKMNSLLKAYVKLSDAGKVTDVDSSKEILKQYKTLQEFEADLKTKLNSEVELFFKATKDQIIKIKDKSDKDDIEYQTEFGKLSFEEQQILLKRNETTKEVSRLPGLKSEMDQSWLTLNDYIRRIEKQLLEINEQISIRTQKRKEVVNLINDILEKQNCGSKLKYEPYGGSSGDIGNNSKEDYFKNLSLKMSELTKENYTEKVIEIISEELPSKYKVSIDDSIEVLFEIYNNQWKQSNQLSSGQKATSVLPLLLIAAKGPIILDQPEDNLDNKYIGSTTVRMFSGRKGLNQILMTSHNATLVVMTDSDFIIEMEDVNNRSAPKENGFLNGPISPIKNSVLEVLDGGEEALGKRFVKYGIEVK